MSKVSGTFGPTAQQLIQRRPLPWKRQPPGNMPGPAQPVKRFAFRGRMTGPLALVILPRFAQGRPAAPAPRLPGTTVRPCGARKRGVALIIVLAGLTVAMVMFLAATKLFLVQQKTIELNARRIQAAWLAESGVRRAAARLAADASYRGETWNVSAEDLGGRTGGAVAIRVEQPQGSRTSRTVYVDADYPSDPQQRARVSREVNVRIKP